MAYNWDKPGVLFLSVQLVETGYNALFLQYKRSRQKKKQTTNTTQTLAHV